MIMVNYGWKWSLLLFGCRSHCRRPYSKQWCKSCQNMNWMTAKSLPHFDRIYKLDNNNIITCIGKCYHLFAPWNTSWHCFYPIDPKDCLKRWWIRSIERIWYAVLLFSQTGIQTMVYSRVTKATYRTICCYTTLLVIRKLLKCQKAYLIITRVIPKDC